MQTIADVMNLDVTVAAGEQPVALGAAMFAATAAGLYPRVEQAQQAMSAGTEGLSPDSSGRNDTTVFTKTMWRSARSWRAELKSRP